MDEARATRAAHTRGRLRAALHRHGPISLVSGIMFVPFALPVVMLLYGAFRSGLPGLRNTTWTTEGFVTAYTDPATYSSLRNSLVLATSVTAISLFSAISLAWIAQRTNTPGRRLVTPVMLTVFATPALFFGLGWVMLANDPIGLLNKAVGWVFDTEARPFDINTWPGLILVSSLKMTSVVYLLVVGPMRAMSRSLEEASAISGASRARTFFRIQIPILAPAITGITVLTFVIMMSVVDIPLLIGTPAGIMVFSTTIFEHIAHGSEYNAATALSLVLMVAVILVVFLQQRYLRGRDFTTVSGKGYSQQRWDIGRWRWVCAAGIGLYTLLAVVLPVGQVVLGSFQPIFGLYDTYTLDNYRFVFTDPQATTALRNTIIVGVSVGLMAAIIAVVISHIQRRSTSPLRRVPNAMIWLVLAMPGIVLSLAMIWAYLAVPGLRTLYGSVTMIIIALVVHGTPIATRASEGAIVQIGAELEEAARVAGASPLRTLVGIVGRLLVPSFLAAWVVTGLLAAGNLDIPLLMSTSQRHTVPVLVYNLYTFGADYAQAASLLVTYLSIFAAAVLLGALCRPLVRAAMRRVRGRGLQSAPTPVPAARRELPPSDTRGAKLVASSRGDRS